MLAAGDSSSSTSLAREPDVSTRSSFEIDATAVCKTATGAIAAALFTGLGQFASSRVDPMSSRVESTATATMENSPAGSSRVFSRTMGRVPLRAAIDDAK
jgi:hypothetical protein